MSIESDAIREEPLYDKVLRMVLWGEPEEKVFAALDANGISGIRADRIYREARKERISTIRKAYAGKAILGGVMITGAIGLYCGFWYGLGMMFRLVLVISAMIGVFGLHKLVDGLIGFAMADKKEGSIAGEI